MIMGSSRRGLIGVDIGTHSVKAAQLSKIGNQLELTSAAIVERETAWNPDSVSVPGSTPLASEAAIRAALERGQFHGRRIASCVSMAVCHAQALHVSEDDPVHRQHAIKAELVGHHGNVPFEYGHWPLFHGTHARSDNIGTLSLESSWANQISSDFRASAADCDILDGVPLALARAVSLQHPSGEPVAAIDWGHSDACYHAVLGHNSEFTRRLRNCGLRRCQKAVMKELRIDEFEVQFLLNTQGVRETSASANQRLPQLVERLIIEPLNDLIAEIDRTLSFLSERHDNLMPQRIYLFGGGATIRNIGPYLTERLGVPVERWTAGLVEETGDWSESELCLLGPAMALSLLGWKGYQS